MVEQARRTSGSLASISPLSSPLQSVRSMPSASPTPSGRVQLHREPKSMAFKSAALEARKHFLSKGLDVAGEIEQVELHVDPEDAALAFADVAAAAEAISASPSTSPRSVSPLRLSKFAANASRAETHAAIATQAWVMASKALAQAPVLEIRAALDPSMPKSRLSAEAYPARLLAAVAATAEILSTNLPASPKKE
jgi:hypothetical protein